MFSVCGCVLCMSGFIFTNGSHIISELKANYLY